MARVVSLQILRVLAATMVVASHLPMFIVAATMRAPPEAFRSALRLGYAGVDVFFVISGFVIALTGPFAAPRPTGAQFFWRRWRRVAPIYFVLSAPVVIGAAMSGPLQPDKLASTYLFWPAIGGGFALPYLDLGWSLCFEMVFYTVTALVLVGGRLRRNLAYVAAAAVVLLTVRAMVPGAGLGFLTSPLFAEFAAGVALAAARRRLAKLPPFIGAVAITIGAVWLSCDIWVVGGPDLFLGLATWASDLRRLLLCGAPAFAIVAGALILEPWSRGRLARLLAVGGDASYSIYLAQFYGLSLLADALWRIRVPYSLPLLSAAGIAGAVACGLVVYRWVEAPILRDLKRLQWAPITVAPTEPS